MSMRIISLPVAETAPFLPPILQRVSGRNNHSRLGGSEDIGSVGLVGLVPDVRVGGWVGESVEGRVGGWVGESVSLHTMGGTHTVGSRLKI